MKRFSVGPLGWAVMVVGLVPTVGLCQYAYPPGYGGWGGWGATTAAGSTAAGMGSFAAGAGAYNEQTAQARATNVNTTMQLNEYMYQSQQVRNQKYYQQQAAKRQRINESADTIYKRLHDNPEPRDVETGDALNVVYDELIAPTVYATSVSAAQQPLAGALVKNIAFQYAPGAVTISLENLSASGVPDVLLTSPAFETDRRTIRGLAQQARKEDADNGKISPETLAKLRTAIKAAQTKAHSVLAQGTPERREADNFLKGLYGLTRMMQTPAIETYLKDLKADQQTTVGQLITFMHSFNLRFGAADSVEQKAAYTELYPMLLTLRNAVKAPPQNPLAAAPPSDPRKLTSFFSGMDYSHLEQAPPTPNAPR
jgi:hypothetical protein